MAKLGEQPREVGEEGDREEYDLIVVGAGPAGLFCAINSAQKDKRILLLEKNHSLGRKLLISGSGRCNLTHDGDVRSFFDHYGDHGRFLRPALMSLTNRDLVSFFEEKGLAMTRMEGGKIFPQTLKSRDVLGLLVGECRAKKVDMRCGQEVRSIVRSGDIFEVVSGSGGRGREGGQEREQVYRSPLLAIATGGRSYPATGSTGDGYRFARDLGHSIVEVGPALTPVFIKDYPFSELAGISVSDVEISLFRNRKIKDHRGDVLFTHHGLSGPGILDLSRHIRPGDVLKLSFVPVQKREDLERWLLDESREKGARGLRSVLADLDLPARLTTRIMEISGISPDLRCAHLTREMRISLVDNLTGLPLAVSELEGFNLAMVTRGGVNLKEVNSKTMESRLMAGLYLVGEVLDVDGDTGGYNLQAAFSTAMLAARSIRQSWLNP